VSAPEIVVVRTGTANVASVLAALRRAGGRPRLSNDGARVLEAPLVVLPGVGAFGAAMEALVSDGLEDAIATRVIANRPLLAICLGLHLLGDGSEESPGERGIGVLTACARRFRGPARVPHLGWNAVRPGDGCELLRPGSAYFAHSYRIESVPDGWRGATADYGSPFVAAVEHDALLACQFHPELSGAWGLDLLRRWIAKGGAAC